VEDLSENYSDLKDAYRKVFKELSLEICDAVEKMSDEEAYEYLKNRCNTLKSATMKSVISMRNEYNCAGCGVCCRFAVSQFSYDELKFKAQNGDKFASQFVSVFVPYENKSEYEQIFAQYLKLLGASEEYYVYHCPKVTEDNKCSDYENRPQICRDFPDNPVAFLPPTCGFMEWKLKSESVWLKLLAETEIINHLLNGSL
jgi:Fe-S-cluster containining protein